MSTAARLALVTGALTFAIWLAPASVQIVSWPQSGPIRLAYVPPLARFWLAAGVTTFVVAALAAFWRSRGRDVRHLASALTPLMLLTVWIVPFLPVLPDRAPLLMILAGPVRWLIGAVALVAAIVRVTEQFRPFRVPAVRLNGLTVFAISAVVYAAFGLQYASDFGFGGDEPHYLVIAHSLVTDHDLDIANDHARRDYRPFFRGDLPPDYLRRGRRGEIYSIHAPGLAALVAPAYAMGGPNATVLVIAVCAALAAVLMYRVAIVLAGASVATIVWAATALTVPFVPHAWLVYPEAPATLIVAFGVLRMFHAPKAPRQAALYGLALSCLPWLHTKFVVLLAPLVAFEVFRLRHQVTHLIAVLAPILIVDAAWLYSFYWMYGAVNPEAPYGTFPQTYVLWRNVPRGIAGLLFDQKFGLLVYSPVYVLAPVGASIVLRDRTHRLTAWFLVATVVAFSISSTRFYMWWGGSSPPARFLVPIVPLVVPMLAAAMARARESKLHRAIVAVVVAVSIGFAAAGVLSPAQELFFSHPHGRAEFAQAIQRSAPLDAALPTFTEPDWSGPLRALAPWLAAAALALGAAVACARWASASAFAIGSTATIVFFATASVLACSYSVDERAAAAMRGESAMLDAYDPSRLRAVDVTHTERLASREVLARLTASQVRTAESDQALAGPFELPEGRYEARLWFEGERLPTGEAIVALGPEVICARVPATKQSPVTLPFNVPVRAPVSVGVTDAQSARTLRRVDVVPLEVPSKSFRLPIAARQFEPAGGTAGGFIAYLDDRTYPEGGVFWTRGTKTAAILISTGRASKLRLTVHVGPKGGPVIVRSEDHRVDLDMNPDETRDIDWPIKPGAAKVVMSFRSARSFVPAEVDGSSDDFRDLGCQVRAHLE